MLDFLAVLLGLGSCKSQVMAISVPSLSFAVLDGDSHGWLF